MDVTIRNVDEEAYRAIKAQAAAEGRTVGEVVSDAMRGYRRRPPRPGSASFFEVFCPVDLGPGNERLSQEIDETLYGLTRD